MGVNVAQSSPGKSSVDSISVGSISRTPALLSASSSSGDSSIGGSRRLKRASPSSARFSLARSSDIERSWKREINSRGYNTLIKLLFFTKFSDAQCGFKSITREAAQALLPHVENPEWFFDTEMLIRGEKSGYRVKEIPVRWVEDKDTRVRFPQDIIKMGSELFRLRIKGPKVPPPSSEPRSATNET